MADQPSSTAAKKSKNVVGKFVRDLFKRPKSINDSASQSNSTGDSVSFALGAHDPVPESADSTASSKYMCIVFILSVIDDLSRCQCYPESGYVLSMNSYLTDLSD